MRKADEFERKRFAEMLDKEFGAGFAKTEEHLVSAYTKRKIRWLTPAHYIAVLRRAIKRGAS
jgi:hypothetical protein